jgi:hypothetical protein
MKKTGSLLLLQKFLDCFFLFNQKPFDLNKIELHFCLIQQSREFKQLINILLQIQNFQHNISSSKNFRVVFHVDNLLIKDLVTFLIFKCNLETKVTVDILNSSLSQKFFTCNNILNLYFVNKKDINLTFLKSRHHNIIFDNTFNFKTDFSGCYSVSSASFDTKTLIFIISLLNSFLSKNYAKMCKI